MLGRRDPCRHIQLVTDGITDLFRNAERLLKVLSRQSGEESESELKLKQNLQRSLAFKLQNMSSQFRQQQKEYLKNLKAQKESSSEIDEIINKKDPVIVDG